MGIPLRVLLIEDSPADAELTLIELRQGGFDPIYERVDTPEAMKAALEKGDWDIILSDYVMPRFSGPAALRIAQEIAADLPFIIVTGQVGEETAVEAMKAGAHDYVLKGKLTRLVPAIRRELIDAQVRRERKRAEAALRRSDEKYRELAESIGDVFFAMDGDLRYTYWNQASEKLSGIPASEAIGKSLYELFPDTDDTRQAERVYREVLETGQPISFVLQYELEGKEFFFEISVYPSQSGLSVFTKDVTDRKRIEDELRKARDELEDRVEERTAEIERANEELQREIAERKRGEEALRESEAKYRTLFNSIDEGFCIIEVLVDENEKPIDYRFLEINPAFEQQTGIENAVGRRIREIAPQLEEHWFEIYGKVALTGQPVRFENPAVQLHRFFDAYAFRVGGPAERKVAILFNDITERKRAEEALRASEERLRIALQAADLGTWDLDLTNDVAVRSLRHDQIWGHHELQPEWGLEIAMRHVLPEDRPLVMEAHARARKTGVLSHENRVVWPDGSIHWIAADGRVYYDGEGRAVRITGVVADVTARKRAEEERERLLAEAQRRAVQLDAANKELEAFTYSASHDLRAPLRHLDGFGRILLRDYADKLDEQGRHYLESVRNSSQKMSQLIDELLKLSRLTRAEMRSEKVSLSEVVESIAAELREEQPEREVDFIIQPGVMANGDPHLLRVVLENLLRNAWKFTSKRPSDGRIARIEFGIAREDGQDVYYVRDNGADFDMTYADKLFMPFQRLHPQEEFPGTGIGLATVQRIIRRHGGRVWAKGEVDKEATFYFTLGV